MSIMQEKDIESLIKKRDIINSKIEMINKQNEIVQKEIEEILTELKLTIPNITIYNIDEYYEFYNKKCEVEYKALEDEIKKAESELSGII